MPTKDKEITDTERLDFIEKNEIDIHLSNSNKFNCNKNHGLYSYGYHESVRQAIDAAIDAAMRGKDGN